MQIAFHHLTPQHPSSNIFKSSISHCRKSSAPGKLNLRKTLSNLHKNNLRKTLSNPHKNLRKFMKMPRPHLNAGVYLLSTSLFQSRGIPLPMTLGLGLRLNGCIQSYTGTTTTITNITTTNISTTTTTTTENPQSHGVAAAIVPIAHHAAILAKVYASLRQCIDHRIAPPTPRCDKTALSA